MNQVEAGVLENKILGKSLSTYYAKIMSRSGWLSHDMCKITLNSKETTHEYFTKAKKFNDKFYEILRDKKEFTKVRASKMIYLWSCLVEETFYLIEKTSKDDVEIFKQEAKVLGTLDNPYSQILLRCDKFYGGLVESIRDYTDELDDVVAKCQKEYVKLRNENEHVFNTSSSVIRIIFYLIQEVFKNIEYKIIP